MSDAVAAVKRGKLLVEGKAKRVYECQDPHLAVVEFTDRATAFDGRKHGNLPSKGACNAAISALAFERLQAAGIATHYVRRLGETELLVRRVDIIAIEVVLRNVVAGSLAQRLGLDEGVPLGRPVLEYYYKSDRLKDPMINAHHARALNLADDAELATIDGAAWESNRVLREFFGAAGLVLVDFKLEFGRAGGAVLLADEVSPDTCRLWDAKSGEKLDKDRFRRDMGGVMEAYHEVLRRLERAWGRPGA